MIIALDMDGTLLNSDGTISERNKTVIKNLQQQGYLVTIATGRAYKDVRRQLNEAKLECPVISLNGAGITLPDHTMIGSEAIDKKELTPALEWAKEQYDLYFEIYTDDEVYAGIHNLEHLEKIVVELSEKVSAESGDGMSDLLKIIQKQFQQAAVTFIEDISTIWTEERKTIYKVLIFSLNKEALEEASNTFSKISGVTITSSTQTISKLTMNVLQKGGHSQSLRRITMSTLKTRSSWAIVITIYQCFRLQGRRSLWKMQPRF